MRRVRVRRWYGIAVSVSVGIGIGQDSSRVWLNESGLDAEVAGRDLGPFFRRNIDSDETLPVRDCLATFGLATRLKPYAGEAYIRQDPTAAPAERARLADLLDLARSADVLHEPI